MIKCFQILINQVRFKHTLCHANTCKKDKFCYICMTGHSFPAEREAEGCHKFIKEIRSIYRLNIIVNCLIWIFQDETIAFSNIKTLLTQ